MRKDLEYVVKNSNYISINNENVGNFIGNLGEIKYKHWSEETNLVRL